MPYDELTNEELTELYRETGDKTIVYVLFSRIRHHLIAMAMDILKDRDDAEDVLSDVLLELFDDLKKGKLSNFGGFSYVKTKNKCFTLLKKKGKSELIDPASQKYLDDLVEIPDLDGLDEKPIETAKKVLYKCIEKLPEKEKQCLMLFYFFEGENGKVGLSYREIAKRTGYTLREVTSALQRARRLVEICMKGSGIDWKNLFKED